jgi:uncharacterized protein YgbK (DUF1537 family)
MKMLVLADDLTGALEVGAKYACEGIASLVTTELSLSPRGLEDDVQVLAIDTDSRHLSPSEAGRRVYVLATVARERRFRYVYKKTDSTLRGNIGRELESLSAAYGGLPVVYSPAYPEMGRTVEHGTLYINGLPVSETGFALDSLNPNRESHIPTLLASQSRLAVHSPPLLDESGEILPGIHVWDGTTEEDVLACARLLLGKPALCLIAGPAALAHCIAKLVDWPRKELARLPSIERCLIVGGSRNEVSIRQIEHALAGKFHSVSPSSAGEAFANPSWYILRPDVEMAGNPLERARRMGEIVRGILEECAPEALFIVGGDTARGIVQALGSPSLYPIGEVVPGVPLSRIARTSKRTADMYLVTKSGGFGPVDIVSAIRQKLQRKD